MEYVDRSLTQEQLYFIYKLKTGALIESSMMIGAVLAGASEEETEKIQRIADLTIAFSLIVPIVFYVYVSMKALERGVGIAESLEHSPLLLLAGMRFLLTFLMGFLFLKMRETFFDRKAGKIKKSFTLGAAVSYAVMLNLLCAVLSFLLYSYMRKYSVETGEQVSLKDIMHQYPAVLGAEIFILLSALLLLLLSAII